MKRIAVAAEKDVVSDHFGLCEDFMFFNTENGKITKIEKLVNPGHVPCELPEKIIANGADTIISGNLGKNAANIFKMNGVEVVVGASGEAREVVDAYIHGDLKSTGELCDAWNCEFLSN
ncbi:MAG TPA: NifB/NifX family molybdenum-iron cluster-binding protein [Sphaerochaetaceae bacterium]|nr:NifB/NifX family molybdenum-iron cluster-binding protein [Sphaerochaetaceae bacterium]